ASQMFSDAVEVYLLIGYLLAGPVVWLLMGFGMLKGRKRMAILTRPAPPVPQPPPTVTALVPAKDEAGQIEACVQSILRQDYPRLDVVAIDDRSTDGTGGILDRLAAGDSRLRVIHLKEGELPRGWGGKSYALHRGLQHATGQWLLFVDADVQLEPDVLSATIGTACAREFHLISILPRFTSATFWEAVLQPLAGAATAGMFMIALTNAATQKKSAFANGQYLCVLRSAYEAVGGHEAIRGTLSEDVAIARKLKLAGFRPRLSWGDEWATVRMYQGFASIFRGWSRNFYVGSLGRPWRIVGLVVFLLVCCLSVVPAVIWGTLRLGQAGGWVPGWSWLVGAAAHLAIMTAVTALMYRWAGEKRWYAILLLPLGVPVLLAICARSLWFCATGRVSWRGTQYRAEELRQSAQPAR
ncbi:MAG: glycosyltransferase, partial [Phycisphaerae bacterium]|nr:glycosyltransferase [Phycisphaerae bacterium]